MTSSVSAPGGWKSLLRKLREGGLWSADGKANAWSGLNGVSQCAKKRNARWLNGGSLGIKYSFGENCKATFEHGLASLAGSRERALARGGP